MANEKTDTDEDVLMALSCVDSYSAYSWPTVAGVLADAYRAQSAEIERLRAELVQSWTAIVHRGGTQTHSGLWDSHAISDVADAMQFLAEVGLFEIESENGRRVFGRFVENITTGESSDGNASV